MTNLNLVELLRGSFFEEDAECIQRTFDQAGIRSDGDLRNAPRKFGKKNMVCGHPLHYLLSEIGRIQRGEPKYAYTDAEIAKLDALRAVASEAKEEEEE